MPSRRYALGERVRVCRGIRNADYPEVSLEGWDGTVIEVHGYDTYTVRWTDETLARADPLLRDRSEWDGVDFETYDIGGDELRPGSLIAIKTDPTAG